MDDFKGKTAVVTGAGSGIGRGIALALADVGANVVVVDIQGGPAATVAAEVAGRGVRSLAQTVDVSDVGQLARLADAVAAAFGPVHVLAANAGVMHETGPLSERTDPEWLWVMSVNLHGIVRTVQAFLPGMRAHGREAHIVTTSSMGGLVHLPSLGIGIYAASKFAAVAYTIELRHELDGTGIGVSVLCPGMVASNLGVTSAQNRPASCGGPRERPPAGIPPELEAELISGEDCGRIVVRGIRKNLPYIITHANTRPLVEAQQAELLACFDVAPD